jgi:hypothetical protein
MPTGLTPPTPVNPGGLPQSSPSQIPSGVRLKPTFVNTTPPVQELSQGLPDQDPTKPWENLDYPSQLPVVPVFKPAIFDSAAPCWGFDAGFNMGDLTMASSAKSGVLTNITVDTQSAVVDMGVNRVDISVFISDFTASCNLNVYQVDAVNGNVLMKSYVGVTRFTDGLFIGGHDGIVLSGAKLVFEIKGITNGATVSVTIEGH